MQAVDSSVEKRVPGLTTDVIDAKEETLLAEGIIVADRWAEDDFILVIDVWNVDRCNCPS